jgi:hypothetical protein
VIAAASGIVAEFGLPPLSLDISAAGVGLFLMATAESFNIISAMCSSPWTAENFGADEEKASSTRKYVMMAAVGNLGLGFGTSLLAHSWWPLIGTGIVSVAMWFVYDHALKKGMAAGSTGWKNG